MTGQHLVVHAFRETQDLLGAPEISPADLSLQATQLTAMKIICLGKDSTSAKLLNSGS